jgi:hypothetical protein
MANTFVTVLVEEHDALPEGCAQRFRATGDAWEVHHVAYEPEDGPQGTWSVHGASSDGSASTALAWPVDDSSAGTSILIVGGDHGLRLVSDGASEGADTVAVPFLLLSRAAVVD